MMFLQDVNVVFDCLFHVADLEGAPLDFGYPIQTIPIIFGLKSYHFNFPFVLCIFTSNVNKNVQKLLNFKGFYV